MDPSDNDKKKVPLAHTTQNWIMQHLSEIMTKVEELSIAKRIKQKEVVVEVDLLKHTDPPIVVKPYDELVQGSRRGMPDWGCRYDKDFVNGLKERQESMNDNMLLFIHRSYDCDFGVCTMTVGPRG